MSCRSIEIRNFFWDMLARPLRLVRQFVCLFVVYLAVGILRKRAGKSPPTKRNHPFFHTSAQSSINKMATIELIKEAITALKDRTGSSIVAITKFIESEKKVRLSNLDIAFSGTTNFASWRKRAFCVDMSHVAQDVTGHWLRPFTFW